MIPRQNMFTVHHHGYFIILMKHFIRSSLLYSLTYIQKSSSEREKSNRHKMHFEINTYIPYIERVTFI